MRRQVQYVSLQLTIPTHGIVQKNPFTMSKKCHSGKSAGQTGIFTLDTKASTPSAVGGAYRDRTDDLKLAKLALSQLS